MPFPRRDLALLLASGFLRSTGTGLVGVQLGLYLATRGLTAAEAGLVVSAGLAGNAISTAVVTFVADRHGRRRTLVEIALLGCVGTLLACAASTPAALAAAALLGMLNGMGRDRGGALVVEQAALPGLMAAAQRTRAFAWYGLLQDAGGAVGSLLAGLPALLTQSGALASMDAQRATLGLNAVLLATCAALALSLSPALEPAAGATARWPTASPRSRALLARLSALFALDALGSGFLTTSLMTWFFIHRFDASEQAIAGLFAAARVLNAVSHLGAAWLARRIGLVNTMVFTHLPSSLLLMTVAVAPSFPVAVVLFLLREGLVEMDVPTRQSYLMAVVAPEERTLASGVTSLVRLAAWAIAPLFAGLLMGGASLGAALVAGAALKMTYDVLLWRAFRHVKPPEEAAT